MDTNDYGLYWPRFFIIEINKNLKNISSLNDLNKNPQDAATFLHEYIHYLQDISSSSLLYDFNLLIKSLQLYLNKIATSKNNDVKVPFELDELGMSNSNDALAYIQTLISDLLLGDSYPEDVICIQKINIPENESFLLEQIQKYNIEERICKNYTQYISITFDNGKSYQFGKRCITESMAYLIESEVYPSSQNLPDLPYNSCTLLCEKIYPELAKNKKWIIALCEIALSVPYSGLFFYQILIEMKNFSFIPHSLENISTFIHIHFPVNFKEIYESLFIDAINQLDFLFFDLPTNHILHNLNQHLKCIFTDAKTCRLNDQFFITKLVFEETPYKQELYYSKLISIFKLPLIKDNTENIYNLQGNDFLFPLLAIKSLMNIFDKSRYDKLTTSNVFECFSYKSCKQNNHKSSDDYICTKCPWKQSDKEGLLCIFALYWKHFNLDNKNLISC
jgi:hypothetical protein